MQDGESFVRNLTNLARWDGCSDPPNEGLNCFAVLKGVEDALQLIYSQELKGATEEQVLLKGWGKPERNQRNLIGLTITYLTGCYVLVGVEARRSHYVHPPLQNVYLSEDPFVMEMFPTNEILKEIPNWMEQNLEGDIDLIHGPGCSFVLDLEPIVVMSVDAAKKICEIVGYGGWSDVLNGVVKEEWISEDIMLEDLLVHTIFVKFADF
jgi:Mediator of RNA polymerase II transcription subunit 1